MLKKILVLTTALFFVSCSTEPTKTEVLKEIKGQIASITKPAKTMKLENPQGEVVVTYTAQTQFINAADDKDLKPPVKIAVMVNDKMVAKSIKVLLVEIPKEMLMSTEELIEKMESKEKIFIGDSRPEKKYAGSHIWGSKATPPDLLKKDLSVLPKDKNQLVVFYCGGITCPLSPETADIAKAAGYTNVKIYHDGLPKWQDELNPVYVEAGFALKNLDPHTIILDIRETVSKHIKSAVHFPLSKLQKMHEEYNTGKVPADKRELPGLWDKKAPIIIYADNARGENVVEASEILSHWKYTRHAVLAQGFKDWVKAKNPVDATNPKTVITYVKKVIPGAATVADFIEGIKTGKFQILDVRTSPEIIAEGKLSGATEIPLNDLTERLNEVSKEKKVITFCQTGARAIMAYDLLKAKSYNNIEFLDDSLKVVLKENNIELKK